MILTTAHIQPARDWRGRLMTAVAAERVLGIPRSSVTTWHQRRDRTQLHAGGVSHIRNWPMFWEADLVALRDRQPIYTEQGERAHREAS